MQTYNSIPSNVNINLITSNTLIVFIISTLLGGTLDVTAHQLQADGKIRELHSATGGAHGGSVVDIMFSRLLVDIFSSKFLVNFRKKSASQWLQLVTDFEKRKKACKKNNPVNLNVMIPWSFAASLYEFGNRDIKKMVKEYKSSGVSFDNGMLRLDGNVVTSLFKPVTDDIVKHIQDLLKQPKLNDVEYLFCVGGFNDSKFLQEVLQEAFGKRFKILIPEEASLAVVKGAILFGQDPDVVGSRVSAKTYGVDTAERFIPFIHHPAIVLSVNGQPFCFGVFEKFVQKGQEVPVGFSRTMEFFPIRPDSDRAKIGIYSSENATSRYVTDPGVEQIGEVNVKWPGFGQHRKLEVTMTFGGTEIEVEAVTYPEKNRVETKISFLAE